MRRDRRGPDSILTRLTLLLLSSLTVLSGSALSAALPHIQQTFSSGSRSAFWVRMLLTTPALFIVICGPLAGALVDRFDRKRLLVSALALYGLAGTAGMYLRTLAGLLISRGLLGVAVSIIFTAATALIADYYQGDARVRFLGFQSAFMAASSVVVTFLGGFLTDLGWPWAFSIYGLAFLIFPLASLYLSEPEKTPSSSPLDVPLGGLLRTMPLRFFLLVFGLTHLGHILFYTIPVQLPFHLLEMGVSSASAAGVILSLNSLMMGVSGILFARFKKSVSTLWVIRLTFGLIAGGYLLLALAQNPITLLGGLVLGGLGLGLNNPNLTAWLVEETPAPLRGRALGNRLTFLFLGQFLSPILAHPLVSTGGAPLVYLAGAGLGFVVFFLSLMTPPKKTG
jgi:MFS family permease